MQNNEITFKLKFAEKSKLWKRFLAILCLLACRLTMWMWVRRCYFRREYSDRFRPSGVATATCRKHGKAASSTLRLHVFNFHSSASAEWNIQKHLHSDENKENMMRRSLRCCVVKRKGNLNCTRVCGGIVFEIYNERNDCTVFDGHSHSTFMASIKHSNAHHIFIRVRARQPQNLLFSFLFCCVRRRSCLPWSYLDEMIEMVNEMKCDCATQPSHHLCAVPTCVGNIKCACVFISEIGSACANKRTFLNKSIPPDIKFIFICDIVVYCSLSHDYTYT